MILNIIGKITVSTKISVCMLFFLYALFFKCLTDFNGFILLFNVSKYNRVRSTVDDSRCKSILKLSF